MKKIVISKFHTSKANHNHSGKTADLSTVLTSTQLHNLIISAEWLFKLHSFARCTTATGTLVQPTVENPKVQHKLLHKRNIQINNVCLSQEFCFDLRWNPYNFVNKVHTHTHTYTHLHSGTEIPSMWRGRHPSWSSRTWMHSGQVAGGRLGLGTKWPLPPSSVALS